MLTSFSVSNFKSLLDVTIEPGSFNVFIGANGCGKSNILEALALLAGDVTNRTTPEDLYNRGYRVARPAITRSAFEGLEPDTRIVLSISQEHGEPFDAILLPDEAMGIASVWWDLLDGSPLEPVAAGQDIPAEEETRLRARRRARAALRSFGDFVIYTPLSSCPPPRRGRARRVAAPPPPPPPSPPPPPPPSHRPPRALSAPHGSLARSPWSAVAADAPPAAR